MAYLGKGLGSLTTANITVDKMTGNGSTATLTITLAQGVNSVNDISVFVSGVMQRPGTDYTLAGSTLTFTTAPATGLQVVAISHGDSVLDCVADATAITASFDNNSVPDSAIGSLAASKLTGALAGAATNLTGLNAAQLTGALPAVAATNLTNLTAANLTGAMPAINAGNLTGITSYIKNASDPAVNTNPASGLGTLWGNTTSGEVYALTDATTDNNVWKNIGSGSGNIEPYNTSYLPGGTVASYQWSGQTGGQFNISSSIERIPYASENGTATGASTLFAGKFNGGGADDASGANGYMMFGMTKASYDAGSSQIQKYAHASSTSAAQTGNINGSRTGGGGYHQSEINMYVSGGMQYASNSGGPIIYHTGIEKVSFASPTSATIAGDISDQSNSASTSSSATHGYSAGGYGPPSSAVNTAIKRFPFAADGDAVTMVAVLMRAVGSGGGWMNNTHGWRTDNSANMTDGITKYSYASDTDAVSTGDLTWNGYGSGHAQSQTKGYWLGAHFSAGSGAGSKVSAFTFATESDQALVGNLQVNRYGAGGTNGSA